MTKPGLGKGLSSLLDETKPLTSPAGQPAGEKSVVSSANGVETEKVKSNGLKVLLSNRQTAPSISPEKPSINGDVKMEHVNIQGKKSSPLLLMIIADIVLISLAFWIILKSKETPSFADFLISVIAIGLGAALVCWGIWERNR